MVLALAIIVVTVIGKLAGASLATRLLESIGPMVWL